MFLRSFEGPLDIRPNELEEEHEEFQERLRKTFYYGKLPGTERPSLPVSDLLVDFYNDAAPRELGKLDNYFTASASRSACISPSSVMAGMVYVKRLKKRQPEYLTQVSSSELFIISMMMASKFLYDEGIDEEVFNDEWASSGDLETEDINQLELDFLSAIDWELFVRPEEFSEMLNKIERRIALQQGLDRGWFSYTDLMVLSCDFKFMDWRTFVSELSTVFSATSLAYLAGILTMVGSTMLGTATSVTVMRAGSQVLPLCIKTLPVLNVDTLLPLNLGSPSLMPTDVNSIGDSELDSEESTEQNQSYIGQSNTILEPLKPHTTEETNDVIHQVRSQNRDQTRLLNGFLSPFLALVTLKDTLFNFAYGASLSNDPQDSIDDDLEHTDLSLTTDETPHTCSLGPCLVDSMSNCWNISMETDWSSSESWTQYNCLDNNRQCSQCMWKMNMNNEHGLDFGTIGDSDMIHCCCSHGNTGNSWLKGSLQPGWMDMNLRFATRSFYPIFVTT